MFSHTARLHCAADLVPLLDQLTKDLAWSDKARFQIELALEELTVNTFSYGKQDAASSTPQDIYIDLTAEQDGADLVVTLVDNAIAFDPTQFAEPDVTSSHEERRVGGLGMFLASKMMDSMAYHRRLDANVMVLRKRVA